MDDNAKRLADGLRRCAEQGIDICDGVPAVSARRCDGCPNQAKMESGNARGCFESWLKAADLIEKLSARADAVERDLKEMADKIRENYGDDDCCPWCKYDGSDIVSSECPGYSKNDCFEWCGPEREENADGND